VWVKREHSFTATIKADSLEQALETAKGLTIDELIDLPGETVDSEHKFTAVMET